MNGLSAEDIQDFAQYLRQCTDAQVIGVFDKETNRSTEGDGPAYAQLARAEAENRGLAV